MIKKPNSLPLINPNSPNSQEKRAEKNIEKLDHIKSNQIEKKNIGLKRRSQNLIIFYEHAT